MDQKKQDLNPELKQIYDRVMNTQVQRPAATPTSTSTPTPTATPPATPQSDPVSATPAAGSPQPSPSLSSSQPHSIPEKKSFVFTGNKVVNPGTQGQAAPASNAKGKAGMSGKIIVALVAVLIVVWGIFWAKFFGLF